MINGFLFGLGVTLLISPTESSPITFQTIILSFQNLILLLLSISAISQLIDGMIPRFDYFHLALCLSLLSTILGYLTINSIIVDWKDVPLREYQYVVISYWYNVFFLSGIVGFKLTYKSDHSKMD